MERLKKINQRACALGWEILPLLRMDGTVKENAVGVNSPDYCGSASLDGIECLLSLYEDGPVITIKNYYGQCIGCPITPTRCSCSIESKDENGNRVWKPGINCLGIGDYKLIRKPNDS